MKEISYLRSRKFLSFTSMVRQLFIQVTLIHQITVFQSTTDRIRDGNPIRL